MSTELVKRIAAYLRATSERDITLYEGHPSVLLHEAADELTALTAKVKEAEQRIAALMSERSSLIATKAEQLVALTKRATTAERERDELAEKAMTVGAMWQDEFDARHALTAKVALLTEALQAIIDMNVQYAKDKYGDASRADGMACVVAARRALSEPDKEEGT